MRWLDLKPGAVVFHRIDARTYILLSSDEPTTRSWFNMYDASVLVQPYLDNEIDDTDWKVLV